MKVEYTKSFVKDLKNLPPRIKGKAKQQIKTLLENPKHPSLNLKKMSGHKNIWEVRVTGKSFRMTFSRQGDTIYFRRVGTHKIYKKP